MSVCCVCVGSTSDSDSLSCAICKKIFHAKCVNLKTNDLDYLKTSQEQWKCQSCIPKSRLRAYSGSSHTSGSSQNIDQPLTMKHFQDLMQAISSISSDLNSLKITHSNIITDISEIKASQTSLQNKFDSIGKAIELHSNTLADHKDLIDGNSARIENLSSLYNNIDSKVTAISEVVNGLKLSGVPTVETAPAAEILERMKRSHNILIHGCVSSGNMGEDSAFLRRCVDEVVSGSSMFIVDTNKISTNSWKICFSCPQIVSRILRNKNALLGHHDFRKVKISDDTTPMQRKHLQDLRDELKTRKERGEKNITIKYIRGEPTIVKSPNNQKN